MLLRENKAGIENSLENRSTLPLPGVAGGTNACSTTFIHNELVADRYKIVRFIGRGGMGEVYEANDLELRQRVALKTVRPEIALDQQAIERFKREIRIAREVTHPNVCRIFDLGHHRRAPSGDEIAFLTMELLAGETLAERLCRTGRMSTAEALPLATQIAAGLGAAHRAGIVHRDLKASNVILVPSAEGQQTTRAVVTDFGLARASAASDRLTELSTASGGIAGTPAYMAPEQVEGGEVTAASDIYSLGIVLYEMVTGALPFVADTPLSTAVKRLREAPPSPHSLVPELDFKWDAAILRCLERNPADRFASAGDVVKALGGETVTPGKRAQRLRLALAGALLVIFFTAAAIYYLRATRRIQEGARPTTAALPVAPVKVRRSVAVLGFKNLSGRAEASWLSTALSEMLTTELAAGEKLRTIPGENIAQVKINLSLADADSYSKETLARIRTNLGADLVVLGSYLALGKESGGQIRLDLRLQDALAGETIAATAETGTEAKLFELVSQAGAHLRDKLGLGEVSAGEARVVKASLPSSPEATRLYAEGLAKLRLFDALAARGLLEKAVLADPQHALAHSALAAAWSALGYDAKATEEAKKAFDLSTNLPREDRLWIEGRYWETAKEWERAVEIYRTLWIFSPDNLDYGLLLAETQISARKAKDALATIQGLRAAPPPARDDPRIDLAEARAADALADFKREQLAAESAATKAEALGAGLLTARAKRSQGLAFYNLGELQKALALFDGAKRIYAAAGDWGGAAWSVNNSANIISDQGDFASARKMYEEALRIWQGIGDKRGMAAAQNNIAGVFLAQGDLTAAKRTYEKTVAISRETNDKTVMEVALSNLGVVRCKQGDLASAKQIYSEALADSREIGDEAGVAALLINIAATLYLQGDLAGATTTYEEALGLCRKIGEDSYRANALKGLGDVLAARGDLIGAQKKHEEALAIKNQLGEKGASEEIRVALAELAIEGGHPASAEAPAREAAEEFRQERATDSEVSAHIVLARSLLEQGKYPAAQEAIDRAKALLNKSENLDAHLSFRITAARVRQASGRPSDRLEAAKSLEAVLDEAKKTGFLGYELEAGLALGEIELQSGNIAQARRRLEALERQAAAQGFGLIVRKAAAALKQMLPSQAPCK
jgi:tetratricopeptide (TPR) repeat protein/tRNA A-37 threonylcarbamoyl transferase component Bud32